jgi:hypothetical protein
MKQLSKVVLLIAAVVFSISSFAQNQPAWKEMTDFHAVMSKTFHPSEDGDFKPVKENASLLVAKAQAWKDAKVPEGFHKEVTDPILIRLVEKCKNLETAVKAKKSDADLKPLIAEAHDVFHEIKEKCAKPEKGEHH